MIQRGGDALLGLQAAMNPDKIVDFINEGAKPSPANVGAPISFSIKHLYDARPVRMSNTLSYTYDKVSFVPRTKTNNVAVFLKNITIETGALGGWEPSNRGHVKLLKACLDFDRVNQGDGHEQYNFYPQHSKLPELGLRSTGYMFVGHVARLKCGFGDGRQDKDLMTLRLQFEILPETYKIGSRGGHHPQLVTLARTFHFSPGKGWEVLTDRDNSDGEAYRSLTAQRTFGNLYFNIRADFSLFVDNVLME